MAYFIDGKLDVENVWSESKIRGQRGLKWAQARDVFTGCYKTLRAGARARMTAEQLQEDLTDLKVPAPVVADFQVGPLRLLCAACAPC